MKLSTSPDPEGHENTGGAPRLLAWAGWGVASILVLILSLKPSVPSAEQDSTALGKGPPAVPLASGLAEGEEAVLARGRELSQIWCAACHVYPEPDILDRFTWSVDALPRMAFWMGFETYDPGDEPGGQRIAAAHLFPDEPRVSLEDWQAICNYYLRSAPAVCAPPPARPPVERKLAHFEAVVPRYPRPPLNTLAHLLPGAGLAFVGNAESNTLDLVRLDGAIQKSVSFPSVPVALQGIPTGMFLACIGSFPPSDESMGSLHFISNPAPGQSPDVIDLVGNLDRPTSLAVADLDQDGLEDLLLTQFGNLIGRFSWFRQRTGQPWEEIVLLEQPGAVKVQVADFNGDAKPDFVVVTAQAKESILLYINQGKGVFEVTPIVQRHPGWGYVGVEVADFNGDGRPDLLAINGDNGEHGNYPPRPRAYHGLRIFLQTENLGFEESVFIPMHGAYGARVRDFDLDGDLDIAAISYFPDYDHAPEDSFLYLENRREAGFIPSTFVESISGKWITLDAADVDGDGDEDLLLAARNDGPGAVPERLMGAWERQGSSILLLRNTTK